ncbi:MAG TPA: hypothetical protein VD997_01500 [Phycisphaerales bacterium]|nr:hypothetical protein [Phycisphaerales bacterium]
MDERQANLWVQLEAFEIGGRDAALTFERRLARENGWSEAFAQRVTAEYKRFLFLIAEAGHPVTPSEQVDQAWHLHMVYTRSYWTDLCQGVVGRPLHHTPTEGGPGEDRKFEQWYTRTLESYRRLFGEEPPADVWPPVEVRFGTPPARWVSTGYHWIIPKPKVKRWGLFGAGAVCAIALGGCTLLAESENDALVAFAAIGVLLVIAAIALWARRGRSGSGCGAGGCGATGCGASTGCGSSGCASGGCGGGGCGGGGD